MLYSMTGYGRAEIAIAGKFFLIEIKSLNGKQFDLRMITPPLLKQYEIQIRNIINQNSKSLIFLKVIYGLRNI